jgi:type IV pilus assembly protein PilY1
MIRNEASRTGTLRAATAALALGLVALAGTAHAQSTNTYFDDTEVFYDQENLDTGNPNILFLLDTGAEMGQFVPGTFNPATGGLKTRMQVLKDSLMAVLEQLNEDGTGVNVGFMRLSVTGGAGAAAAKGGLVARAVQPLTSDALTDFRHALCMPPNGDVLIPTSLCLRSFNNAGSDSRFVFGTQNQMGSGAGAAPVTEMLFEAYLYYAGMPVLWGGQQAQVGPSWNFRSEPRSITPQTCGPIINDANGLPSCTLAANQGVYKSPAANKCQANFIIVVSDGVVAEDTGNDSGNEAKNIQSQPGFSPYLGPNTLSTGSRTCSRNLTPGTSSDISFTGRAISRCADDLAYYMDQFGVGPNRVPVTTYTIGFDVDSAAGPNAASARNFLQLIARAGGGRFLTAANQGELVRALTTVVNEIVIQSASFSSPAVAVNAFNRTQNLDSLYMSVFSPQTTARWPGNVKKYRLAPNGDILDAEGNSAVDSNGFFRAGRRSLWTPANVRDGADATLGGAASRIPLPVNRKIYTNTTGTTRLMSGVTLAGQPLGGLKSLPESTKNALLGITCTSQTDPIANPNCPSADQLIDWTYGMDVQDLIGITVLPDNGIVTGNGDYTEPRRDMGDPLHGRPAVVVYGQTGSTDVERAKDSRVYAVTNDGFLHSFDSETGVEQWSFIPATQLGRLARLYQNTGPGRPRKSLGLDGTIRVVKLDRCGDGVVNTAPYSATNPCGGDRVYLYFGMRRGGSHYYALDVTFKDNPRLMWVAGPVTDSDVPSASMLPRIGQTWSTPTVARATVPGKSSVQVRASGAGIDDHLVLVFGGGYDSDRYDATEPLPYPASTSDDVGNSLYIVDAVNGTLLWRAGPGSGSGSSPNLALAQMTHAFPGDVRPIDFTGDGLVDVIYAADLGGRVWRFDVDNAAGSMSGFIRGGVFASLGAPGSATTARRFFAAPDVAFIRSGAASWFNIAIGSGNRELPVRDQVTDDKFYSLRDYRMLTPYDWSGGNAWEPITDADLTDVTPVAIVSDTGGTTYQQPAIPDNAKGWKLTLDHYPGEKVITESRTFENVVFFTSFYPKKRTGEDDTDADVCTTTLGYNNLYTVNAVDARPCVTCIQGMVEKGKVAISSGLGVILKQPGIAPEPVFLFPGAEEGASARVPPVCLVGAESCGTFGSYEPKRTYWMQRGAE